MMQYVVASSPTQKNPGDTYGATLTFQHKGPAMQVWVGIALAYAGASGTCDFAMKQVSVNSDATLVTYTVTVSSTIPQDAPAGTNIGAYGFISKSQPGAGQVPTDDFKVNKDFGAVYATSGGGFDLSTMMPMLFMVMMMGMIMPMMGEETPAEQKTSPSVSPPALQAATPTALLPAPESKGKGVTITIS